jgi:aminomethyltransferase
MDRSHEGRFEIIGADRLNIMHRISTNDLMTLEAGEGRPTMFTNAIARVLDRATIYQRGERALVISEPGRGEALRRYLQKNIFFNDDAHISDLANTTRQFVVHGPDAERISSQFAPDLAPMHSTDVVIAGIPVILLRDTPLSGSHWRVITPSEGASKVWTELLAHGLTPAGSLTYNVLRIRAGRPGVGRELSIDYIPLELGLWDEVSFTKGCYTGQEIIARMESRGRLAKTIITVRLSTAVDAPAKLFADGHEVGMLTSSVQTPDGDSIGIGVVKIAQAQPGATLLVGEGISAEITGFPGAQPPNFIE